MRQTLEQNLLLFYTGIKRDASEVLRSQSLEMSNKRNVLQQMRDLVAPLREVLSSGVNLSRVGEILHEGWELKRSMMDETSSGQIDEYYIRGKNAGALGGKLLGAGGGGFLLFYVEPQNHQAVIEALSDLYQLKFGLDSGGSQIIYYGQSGT